LTAAKAPQAREPIAASATKGIQNWLISLKAVLIRRINVRKIAIFTGKTKNAKTGAGAPS
jgi:hypothetical protein